MAATADRALEDNRKLIESYRAQLRKLGVVYNVTRILTRTREPHEALEWILDEVVTALGATSGSIALVDPSDGDLKVAVSRGFGRRRIDGLVLHPGEGITGWVAEHRKSLLVKDVRQEKRYVQVDSRIQSELCVPILLEDRVIGVINVDHTKLDAFDRNDREMLEAVAVHAAAVHEVAELFRRLEARTRELERSQEIGRRLVSTLDAEDVFERIAEAARELLDVKSASLFLIDPTGVEPDVVARAGIAWRRTPRPVLVGRSRIGEAILCGGAVRVTDLETDPLFQERETAIAHGLKSLLALPVVDQERPVGALVVYAEEGRTFDDDDEKLLAALADQAAVAIRSARYHEDRLKSEEQRSRNERTLLLGTLAAEVAHEVRNPLSVMNLLVHSLTAAIEPETTQGEDLRVLKEQIDHLESVTRRVLALADARPRRPTAEDLEEVVRSVLKFVAPRLHKRGVEASVKVDGNPPRVRIVRSEIEQALLNLVLNAEQAMDQGGTLKVRIHERDGEDGVRYVCISLSDTGGGIDPATRMRILEPFFTTRAEGSGLGLSVVHRIVVDHGGALRIRSRKGKGSTFTIEVPVDGR